MRLPEHAHVGRGRNRTAPPGHLRLVCDFPGGHVGSRQHLFFHVGRPPRRIRGIPGQERQHLDALALHVGGEGSVLRRILKIAADPEFSCGTQVIQDGRCRRRVLVAEGAVVKTNAELRGSPLACRRRRGKAQRQEEDGSRALPVFWNSHHVAGIRRGHRRAISAGAPVGRSSGCSARKLRRALAAVCESSPGAQPGGFTR